MENASKALIIAGAILLAILIIGLGVYIYNQASNSIGDTGMDQTVARQFNGQFEPYINKTIDSTAAKALIDTVNSLNGSNIRLDFTGVTNKSSVKTGHKYGTDVGYSNGVISSIYLYDKDGSTQSGADDPFDPDDPGSGEHSIEESTDDFNRYFKEYVGENKTWDDIKSVAVLINNINNKYGPGTVELEEQKAPSAENIIDNIIISINNTYSDGKIREIGISFEYHEETDAEFNARFTPYLDRLLNKDEVLRLEEAVRDACAIYGSSAVTFTRGTDVIGEVEGTMATPSAYKNRISDIIVYAVVLEENASQR